MHSGLQDELEVDVEVVYLSLVLLVVFVVALVHVHLAKVVCNKVLLLHIYHVEDAVVLEFGEGSLHILVLTIDVVQGGERPRLGHLAFTVDDKINYQMHKRVCVQHSNRLSDHVLKLFETWNLTHF